MLNLSYPTAVKDLRLSDAEIAVLRQAAAEGVIPDVNAESYAHLSALGLHRLIQGSMDTDVIRYRITERGREVLALADGGKS